MRSRTIGVQLAMLCLCTAMAVTVWAGCEGGQRAQPAAEAEPAPEAAKAPGTDVAAETAQESEGVTATLTYIEVGKDGPVRKTKGVPYLPPGKKIATLDTTKGTIKIELWESEAPNTVVNFVYLANSGRYDGVEFHRVIDGFMAQTGDVEHKHGYGGPGYSIPAEFNPDLKHVRGVVSMARSSDPDSAGSQFFIMLGSAPHLDGQYAAFGKVIEGMDVVDSIKKGDKARNGVVDEPDKILKARVESIPEE